MGYWHVVTHDVRNLLYMEELVGALENHKMNCLRRRGRVRVQISPCISTNEKEIVRATLDAKLTLIVLLENGFPPIYKPPKYYFEVCAEGRLLMLAP